MKKSATKSPRRRTQKKQSSASTWLTAGIILGMIVVASLWYWQMHSWHHQHHERKAKSTASKTSNSAPQFDFYTMLPNMQVGAENNSATTHTPAAKSTESDKKLEKPMKKTVPHNKKIYFLQTSAFRNFADADKIRAELILEGFTAKIVPLKTAGTTWNRVWIGPYNNRHSALKAQKHLKHKSIIVEQRLE